MRIELDTCRASVAKPNRYNSWLLGLLSTQIEKSRGSFAALIADLSFFQSVKSVDTAREATLINHPRNHALQIMGLRHAEQDGMIA